MNEIKNLSEKIFELYGSIKRARGCFLYTAKGIRLTDMYQEGGRAILGWGADSSYTMFKNALNRGACGSFITDYDFRTKKAVNELLDSEREVYYYTSKTEALRSVTENFENEVVFYRPWDPTEIKWNEQDCVLIVPPLPWTDTIYILAIKTEKAKSFNIESDCLPSAIHAGISRSIYNLIKALQQREEKCWFVYDKVLTKYWTRKGPYLFPKLPKEKYNEFVEHCLKLGLVISPCYENPSIVPFGADVGVFSKLKKLSFCF